MSAVLGWRARLALMSLTLVVGASAWSGCGGTGGGGADMAVAVDASAGLGSCILLSECVLSCADDASCAAACTARSTSEAKDALDALNTCVAAACTTMDDGGVAPCSAPDALACKECKTNAAHKAPADCAQSGGSCGSCYAQARACTTMPE